MATIRKILTILFFLVLLPVSQSAAQDVTATPAAPSQFDCVWPDGIQIAKENFPDTEAHKLNRAAWFHSTGTGCELGYFILGVREFTKDGPLDAMYVPDMYIVLVRQIFGDQYIVGKPTKIENFDPAVTVVQIQGQGAEIAAFYFIEFVPQQVVLKATVDLDGNQQLQLADPANLPDSIQFYLHLHPQCGFPSKYEILSRWDGTFADQLSTASLDARATTNQEGIWEVVGDCQAGYTQIWLGGHYLTYFVYQALDGSFVISQPVLSSNFRRHFRALVIDQSGLTIFDSTVNYEYHKTIVHTDGSFFSVTQDQPFDIPSGALVN